MVAILKGPTQTNKKQTNKYTRTHTLAHTCAQIKRNTFQTSGRFLHEGKSLDTTPRDDANAKLQTPVLMEAVTEA